jgi:hypothetical protein
MALIIMTSVRIESDTTFSHPPIIATTNHRDLSKQGIPIEPSPLSFLSLKHYFHGLVEEAHVDFIEASLSHHYLETCHDYGDISREFKILAVAYVFMIVVYILMIWIFNASLSTQKFYEFVSRFQPGISRERVRETRIDDCL